MRGTSFDRSISFDNQIPDMMKKHFLPILLVTGIFISCGANGTARNENTPPDSTFYFEGMLSYMDSVAFLRDCSTGALLPLKHLEPYPQGDSVYLEQSRGELSPVYVELWGHLAQTTPTPDAKGPESWVLVVDSLLNFSRTNQCDPERMVSGFYTADLERIRMNIMLNGSYHFTLNSFLVDDEKSHDTYTGRWMRLSPDRLVLFYEYLNGKKIDRRDTLNFNPSNSILTQELDGSQVIYEKTFL